MKVFLYNVTVILIFLNSNTYSQALIRTCATDDILMGQMRSDPSLIKKMDEIEKHTIDFVRKNPKGAGLRTFITIPVVVHIIYDQSFPVQNISDEQIQSQIDILNQDFSATNSEITGANLNSINYPLGVFSGMVANAEVQFCLARRDPSGFPTSGITRKASTRANWETDISLKKSSLGGVDPWDRSKYLNIWITKISISSTNVTLGYAQLPGGDPTTDGVVIDYRFFGNTGTAIYPFNKGRTATHEIGHWLNLKHIWGDASCGDDGVSDTPKHNAANTGCQTSPHLSSCTGTPTEMTMNYLDYSDDRCMYMFSTGQKARMQAVLSSGAARGTLSTSPGCLPPDPNICYVPTGLNIGNIGLASATASWGATANSLSYSFEYKLNTATTWNVFNATETSVIMSGLIASSTYNTRVKSTCASGATGYSPTINFVTLAPPTCNVPSSLTTANITATSAKSNWGVVANVIDYTYEYKTKAATVWTVAPPVTINTYQLTGLLPATTYNVRIKTNCNGMASAYSSTVSFVTLAACAGDSESNNTATTARTTLRSGTAINGKLGTITDIDWFKFVNTSSAKNIKITLSGLTADYNVELYYGTSTLVSSSQNSGLITEEIKYNNGLVGTYYIKVYGVNSVFDNINCYKLLAQAGSTVYRLGFTGVDDINLPLDGESLAFSNPLNDEGYKGVKDVGVSADIGLLIFPNPSNSEVSIVLPLGKNHEGTLLVYGITGKVLFSEKIKGDTSLKTFNMDISQFKSGIYMINFTSEQDSYTQKMVVSDIR